MSWPPTKSMPPSPHLARLKSMKDDEFIALNPGLLRHPSKVISRRHRQAAPGADASAFQGRLSARVALLQSPILPAAGPPYPHQREFRKVPVDNTQTWLPWAAIHMGDTPGCLQAHTSIGPVLRLGVQVPVSGFGSARSMRGHPGVCDPARVGGANDLRQRLTAISQDTLFPSILGLNGWAAR